jgi:hypothetical protein
VVSISAAIGATLPPYVFTEAPQYRARGERFPAGARLVLVEGGTTLALVPGFAASAGAAVSFDGKRVLFAGKQKPGEPWRIWEIPLAGGAPRRVSAAPLAGGAPLRLTYGEGDHIASDVLLDGRILFDAPHLGAAREVFTVYTDGSGVETVRCDHGHDRHSGRRLASGDIVFVSGTRLARFTSARAVELPLVLPAGEYAGPVAELAPGELLVSWRASRSGPFKLRRVHIGRTVAVPAASGAGNAVEPVLVQPHAIPKRHPSGLGDRNGANLLCLNAYASREGAIPEGLVAAVRVWAQDDRGASVALGQAPVEKDGSFYVQVPSERPIRFELLGRDGKTVRAARTWFWARRGEQRVCVGCHTGPERAPDNAQPEVLLRTTEPVKMALPVHSGNGGNR